jgi:hypothetical protein
MGYVVSRGGTFGTVDRRYRTEDGVEVVVIRWGTLSWLTPVLAADVIELRSQYESEARREASNILGRDR